MTTTAELTSSPPYLSFAERDRRHTAIRERMAQTGIDVLVLPANSTRWEQSMADSRYVSGIGGFGTETLTIVPRDHEASVHLFNRSGWWKAHPQNWIADVRDGRNRWGDNIVERLNEIKFTKGTIGMSGLGGGTRTPDGLVTHATYERVRTAFPDATIVDASALILNLRSIKSPEEVAVLERSAAVTDSMVDAMIKAAAPGVTERAVHAAIVQAMLLGGGDLPSLLIFASGPWRTTRSGSFVPTTRVIQENDVLVNELEARIAGYGAQTVAPVWIGKPDPAYQHAIDIATAGFNAVLEHLRPGATMGSLMKVYSETLKRESNDTFTGLFPMMHARGLGDEIPAVLGAEDLASNDMTIAENMVFVLKPGARSAEGIVARVGDTVVVTPSGGRRLGRRNLGLAVTG